MSEQTVREGALAWDKMMKHEERVEAKMKELLPEVMASPEKYDFDVDLLDNGDFLEFLQATFAKPDWQWDGVAVWNTLFALNTKYQKLAEKKAEELALDAIEAEDEQGGHTG